MNRFSHFASVFFWWTVSASTVFAQPLFGDNNKDGFVDSKDQLILLRDWHKGTGSGTDTVSFDLPGPSIRLVRIPAGSFMMGSPDTERSRQTNEGPVHQVTIDYDFYMGETEVTQAQWAAVMGSCPAQDFGEGNDYPVYNVSWDDCQAFLTALNAVGQGTFRLPSEAEWEYACRAGTTTRFYFGDSLGCVDNCEDYETAKGLIVVAYRSDFIWYCPNSGDSTHPVRQRLPNEFGLYDMMGNVWECCQDFAHSDYTEAPNEGSARKSAGGTDRVIHGGGLFSVARDCRSAIRAWRDPAFLIENHVGH